MRGTLGEIDVGEPRGEYVVVLAGRPAETSIVDDDRIRDALRAELATGSSKKDAVAAVSKAPRRAAQDRLRTGGRARLSALYPGRMGQYVAVAGSGPSAAFFDLDRTLIAGSSAFALATAARKMKMMPTHELLRDAVTAATFKFRGDHDTGAADNARDRVLGFIEGHRQDDLAALNERVLPGAARQDQARGAPAGRHAPPRRAHRRTSSRPLRRRSSSRSPRRSA